MYYFERKMAKKVTWIVEITSRENVIHDLVVVLCLFFLFCVLIFGGLLLLEWLYTLI